MSRVFHTSDWHIGHKSIIKYRDEFESLEHHDNTIIENYCNTIRKRDTVYFHGDICFDKNRLHEIKSLPGHKILIIGNHDTDFYSASLLLDTFDKVYAMKKYKGFWLTHCPMHESELRGKINIHGHSHKAVLDDPRYINICLEHTNYMPVNRDEIIDTMEQRLIDIEAIGIYK